MKHGWRAPSWGCGCRAHKAMLCMSAAVSEAIAVDAGAAWHAEACAFPIKQIERLKVVRLPAYLMLNTSKVSERLAISAGIVWM